MRITPSLGLSRRASRTRRQTSRVFGYLESLEERRLLTLVPELVADLNLTGAGITVTEISSAQDHAYFVANDQLGVTDGTVDGTKLVPGIAASSPVVVGNTAFTGSGRYLWRTDTTEEGTLRIELPMGESEDGGLFSLVAASDRVYFTYSAGFGRELWTSDGTAGGTRLVKDIRPGSRGSEPGNLVTAGNRVYFTAEDSIGRWLWASDGTEAGTVRLDNVSDKIDELVAVDDRVYFSVLDLRDQELWTSDGTIQGTRKVKDIAPGGLSSSPRNLTAVGNKLYFTADDGVHGRELWVTDGSDSGTRLLVDFAQSESLFPTGSEMLMVPSGDTLFFVFSNRNLGRLKIWKSDGTESNTVAVTEIIPWESGASTPHKEDFVGGDGDLYFLAYSWPSGMLGLWKTDGTGDGTEHVIDFAPTRGDGPSDPALLAVLRGKLIFTADLLATGPELWTSDGTNVGTHLLKDLNHGTNGSHPKYFEDFRGRTLFIASDWEHPQQLWVTDGTTDGTIPLNVEVKTTYPSRPWDRPSPFVVGNHAVYFRSGNDIWRTDGTIGGTYRIIEGKDAFTLIRDTILFAGGGLWAFDTATNQSHPLVANLSIDLAQSAVVGNRLFFAVRSTRSQPAADSLWVTDGTPEGTYMVKDIRPGAASAVPQEFHAAGDKLFFTADDGVHGRELWVSDGTEQGTQLVRDLHDDENDYRTDAIPWPTAVGDRLFFLASNEGWNKLWVTDGTEAGTVPLPNSPKNPGGYVSDLVQYRDALYYNNSGEIWTSDGTTEGTKRALSWPTLPVGKLIVDNDRLLLVGSRGELYVSDGTDANTLLVVENGFWNHPAVPPSIHANGNTLWLPFALPGLFGELTKLTAPLGDTNFDLRVDLEDLNNVRDHLGGYGFGDSDHDGDVDLDDLNAVRNGMAADVPAVAQPALRRGEFAARDAVFGMLTTAAEAVSFPGGKRAGRAAGR